MAMMPPSHDDLAQIEERYGFRLRAQDVEEFRTVMIGALASCDAVERMYQAHRPEAPGRPYQWPADSDNELGAWYVTAEIKDADDGPLAGRRVAVKDNIEVAGLPMMNGSVRNPWDRRKSAGGSSSTSGTSSPPTARPPR